MNITDIHNRLDTDIRQHTPAGTRPAQTTGDDSSRSNNLNNVDRLFLNNLKPQQATDFLAQHINRGLREGFQLNQPTPHGFVDESGNPRAAINQIIQTANQALRKLIPDHGVESAAQQVRGNVDQGYSEAIDIFSVFGNIAKETRERLAEARDMLDKAYQQAPLNGNVAETEALFIDSSRHSSQSSTSLSIETADGDIVTIDLSHSLEQSSSQFSYETAGKSLNYRESEKNESIEINIHVKGNLDEDEKKAIGQLVKQLNQVGNQHDNGQQQDALQLAGNLSYDSSIIKSFDYAHSVEDSSENASYTQQQTSTPLAVEEAPVSNIIETYSFLPFKDMRMAVNAILEKLAEFRASLDESRNESPATPVKEEA